MNKKGMDMLHAIDAVSDDMLLDALPPGMGSYATKRKTNRVSGFFERPWVAAVISASVALAVLAGVVWAGQRAAENPVNPAGDVAGNPQNSQGFPAEDEKGSNRDDVGEHDDDTGPSYDNPPVAEDAKVIVSSGGYTISPAEYLQWRQTWNAELGKMEETRDPEQWGVLIEEDSGMNLPSKAELLKSLPRVPYAEGFSFSADASLKIMAISAFDENLRHAYSASLDMGQTTVEAFMRQLSRGSYTIFLFAYEEGKQIESANRKEGAMYEFLFGIDVLGADETSPKEPPVINPPETPKYEGAMGIEIWVGLPNTCEQLTPYCLYAYHYDEGQNAWVDVDGYGLAYLIETEGVTLPTLTYEKGFAFYTKPTGSADGDVYLESMVIYDENLQKLESYHNIQSDLAELSELPVGVYHVVLSVTHLGRTFDGNTEKGEYEYGFTLKIPEGWNRPSHGDQEENLGFDSVLVISGKNEIHPAYKNEWTKADVSAQHHLLPAVLERDCFLDSVKEGESFQMCYLKVYRVEGDTLTMVKNDPATNLYDLHHLPDGYYCVVFTVQWAADEDVMLTRDYAFMLYAGYTADVLEPLPEPLPDVEEDTVRPAVEP